VILERTQGAHCMRPGNEQRREPMMGDCLSVGAFAEAFPIRTVKSVLRQTGKDSKRERLLANHIVVYYVMSMAVIMTASYREVMRRLLEGNKTLKALKVSAKPMGKPGISQARERLGCEPFKILYEQFVQPIATEKTRGASYKSLPLLLQLRLVAGCFPDKGASTLEGQDKLDFEA
jgi:hypothetical protein